MTEMRVLTVRQPWAWAIIHGGKDVENRVRNIAGTYRGLVAIHAGLSKNPGPWWLRVDPPFGSESGENFGVIIGVAELVGVHEADTGDCNQHSMAGADFSPCSVWAEPDGYHLVLEKPRPFETPIPYRGALGLRRLEEEIIEQIMNQIGSK